MYIEFIRSKGEKRKQTLQSKRRRNQYTTTRRRKTFKQEDDNDDNVKTEIILPTQLDRDNPRIEITIKSI